MTQKYTKILVTKLNPKTHDELKQLAKDDRRSLSSMSRNIIEDYLERLNINNKKENY